MLQQYLCCHLEYFQLLLVTPIQSVVCKQSVNRTTYCASYYLTCSWAHNRGKIWYCTYQLKKVTLNFQIKKLKIQLNLNSTNILSVAILISFSTTNSKKRAHVSKIMQQKTVVCQTIKTEINVSKWMYFKDCFPQLPQVIWFVLFWKWEFFNWKFVLKLFWK